MVMALSVNCGPAGGGLVGCCRAEFAGVGPALGKGEDFLASGRRRRFAGVGLSTVVHRPGHRASPAQGNGTAVGSVDGRRLLPRSISRDYGFGEFGRVRRQPAAPREMAAHHRRQPSEAPVSCAAFCRRRRRGQPHPALGGEIAPPHSRRRDESGGRAMPVESVLREPERGPLPAPFGPDGPSAGPVPRRQGTVVPSVRGRCGGRTRPCRRSGGQQSRTPCRH